MFDFFKNICYSVNDSTLNKFVLQCKTPSVLSRVRRGYFTFIGDSTMDEKILDAVCVLPRIEMLCDFLSDEADQLENYLHQLNADQYMITKFCEHIRQLAWITEDISKQVFTDVNKLLGV